MTDYKNLHRTNKSILVITHVCPYPPGAGNEIRIFNLLSYLTSLKYEILLLIKADSLQENALEGLSQITKKVFYSGSLDQSLESAKPSYINQLLATKLWKKISHTIARLRRRVEANFANKSIQNFNSICNSPIVSATQKIYKKYKPFAVIAEYIFMSPCLEVIPDKALKIIDTHDVFSRKLTDVNAYGIDDELSCTKEEEREHLLRANLILGIQNNETALLKSLAPEREVITIGIDFPIIEKISEEKITPNTILVIGSDNPLNIHGLTSFLEYAWPMIHQKNPQAVLTVAGRLASVIQTEAQNIVKIGWVPDLDILYQTSEIVINPTIAGTGLKIKSVEALCHGKPLVAWENGIEGIIFSGEAPFIVCDSWSDFANACLHLLENQQKRCELQQLALNTARENFSQDVVYAPLIQKLKKYD